MKRRDFLIGATSSASLVYLKPVSAAIPCPPALSGGTGAPPCPAAAGDWQSRISGPGVVWFHGFENDDEVNNFRFGGGIGTDRADVYSTVTNPAIGYIRRITSEPNLP